MNSDFGVFLALVSGLNSNIVPEADANDALNGATQIPDEVTDARRVGKLVPFVQHGGQANWYWVLPNGKKIYHPAP